MSTLTCGGKGIPRINLSAAHMKAVKRVSLPRAACLAISSSTEGRECIDALWATVGR